jgi:transposase
MEYLILSEKEIKYANIIPQIIEGKMSQSQAALLLGISIRQTKRLCKKVKANGISALVNQNRGRPSNRKIPLKTKEEILSLVKEKYTDFSYQLIQEQLKETHNICVSPEWIRQMLIKEGFRQVIKQKTIKTYQRRARRSRKGELIQIDGSYHLWFENRGPKCCLLVSIDDATSELCELKFVEHESTSDYMDLIKGYVEKYGCPLAFYSDRLNIFQKGSQLHRALKELDIALINANSPQAKGRVERANGTLQDRLIKLMRLKNISTMEEGNRFLEEYIKEHNKKYGRKPKNDENAHREYSQKSKLKEILCIKEERKISKDLMIQYKNKLYALETNGVKHRLIGKKAIISEVSGKVKIDIDGKLFKYKIIEESPYIEPKNRKEAEAWLDRKKPLSVIQRVRKGKCVNF